MWWNHDETNSSVALGTVTLSNWLSDLTYKVQSIEQFAKKIKAITSNNQIHKMSIIFKRHEYLYLLPDVVWASNIIDRNLYVTQLGCRLHLHLVALWLSECVCIQVSCAGACILSHRFQRLALPLHLHVSIQSTRSQDWFSLSREHCASPAPSVGPIWAQDRRAGANSEDSLFYTLGKGLCHPESIGESGGGDTMTHYSTNHTIESPLIKNWSWRPC